MTKPWFVVAAAASVLLAVACSGPSKSQVAARSNVAASCHVLLSVAELVSGPSSVTGSRIDAELQRALDYGDRAAALDQNWKPYDTTLQQYVGELRARSRPSQNQGQELTSVCVNVGVRASPRPTPTT